MFNLAVNFIITFLSIIIRNSYREIINHFNDNTEISNDTEISEKHIKLLLFSMIVILSIYYVNNHNETKPTIRNKNTNSRICAICYEPIVEQYVMNSCGHSKCCRSCLGKIMENTKQCPICRSNIKSIIKIYD